ncbi:hypothetical protein [Streptococcus pneumoniae]|nr:hypothetical protein [Streptococcus pneumoniae]SPR77878.1 chlorohydrolase [Streptococcus pneumoniae]
MGLTKSAHHTYGKATLTWFEEIFEDINYYALQTSVEVIYYR